MTGVCEPRFAAYAQTLDSCHHMPTMHTRSALTLAITILAMACSHGTNTPAPVAAPAPAAVRGVDLGKLSQALVSRGYAGDTPPPGGHSSVGPSLHLDMIWEGGLKLTAVPDGSGMRFYLIRPYACPDSLTAVNSDCLLRDVILVATPIGFGDPESFALVARTVVGPRKGPIRPWPTSARVRGDAGKVAERYGGAVLTAEDLPAVP
jgi:hypothetical protein